MFYFSSSKTSMSESNSNIAVLSEAKAEYTKQLINILRVNIYQGIKSIYNDAKAICEQKKALDDILIVFQELLSRIPKWSQEIIDKEYSRIEDNSQCDWLEDLITAVFISHTKVLTLVHQGKHNKKINIKIPKASHFMHLCYIESAREIWRYPYLFSERLPQYQYQKNMRDSEQIIADAISETIRKQLPVKNILKEYLGDGYTSEVSEEEDVKTTTSNRQKKNLRKLVKKEIELSQQSGSGFNGNGNDDDDDDDNDNDDDVDNDDDDDAEESNSDNNREDDDTDTDTDTESKKLSESDYEDNLMIRKLINKEIKKVIGNKEYKTKRKSKTPPVTAPPVTVEDLELSDIEMDTVDISLDNVSTPILEVIESKPVLEQEPVLAPVVEAFLAEPVKDAEVETPLSRPVSPPQPTISIEVVGNANQYRDVEAKESDIKEINIGSKVINGLKDFLGINKIDDTSKIETYETPVKTNTLAIQQLDDIDLELESSGNGGGISDVEGSSSDLELDCLDVDLDNVANSNNEKKKEFTFF